MFGKTLTADNKTMDQAQLEFRYMYEENSLSSGF